VSILRWYEEGIINKDLGERGVALILGVGYLQVGWVVAGG